MSIQDHYIHLYGPEIITAEAVKEASGHENQTFEVDDQPDEKRNGSLVREEKIHCFDDLSRRTYRDSLKTALDQNPINRLHQVVDRNLSRVEDLDVNHHLRQRKRSARHIRARVMSGGDSDRFEDIPENDVDVMKAKHKEFRRRKSTIIHRASRDKTDAAAPADTDNNESESTGL